MHYQGVAAIFRAQEFGIKMSLSGMALIMGGTEFWT